MPKSRRWGEGAACLLVGDAALRDALGPELDRVGLAMRTAAGDAGAAAALEREPLAVALVTDALGPAVVAAILARAHRRHPEVPVIVLGATGSVEEAVEAMRRGAADYLAPPLDPAALLGKVQRLVAPGAPAAGPAKPADVLGLVGASPAMLRVFGTLEKVTRYKTNVLLLGESGTGKELIARALHARGPRRQHLFVPINCATLGRELLENELFGHERGAFPGADERKKGLFELADRGTVFFDEIGEMDLSTQAKLLRVLERNEFRRVGGTEKVKVDLGVIAATNRDLPSLIAAGRFREDLYYRLKVVTLVVPPLRERKEDIPALIDAFIADFNRRNSGKIRGIAPLLLRRFMDYDWPGNVRELKHAVESAAVLAPGDTIDVESLEALSTPRSGAVALGDDLRIPIAWTLDEAERELILAHVRRAKTKEEAARTLGIGLRTLYTKLRQYEAKRA